MVDVEIKEDIIPSIDKIINLYDNVGWKVYTDKAKLLKKAIDNSLKVWTVWKENELIGLARVIGDDSTIIYIQDILVLQAFQNMGIGSRLLETILENYKDIRQIVLLTDITDKTIGFYEKNGLKKVSEFGCLSFMRLLAKN